MARGVKGHYTASGGRFWQGATYRLAVVIAYRLSASVRVIVNGARIFGIGLFPFGLPVDNFICHGKVRPKIVARIYMAVVR